MGGGSHHSMWVAVRRQPVGTGAGSLLPLHGSEESNSGCQAWQHLYSGGLLASPTCLFNSPEHSVLGPVTPPSSARLLLYFKLPISSTAMRGSRKVGPVNSGLATGHDLDKLSWEPGRSILFLSSRCVGQATANPRRSQLFPKAPGGACPGRASPTVSP